MPVSPSNVEAGRNGHCHAHAIRQCHVCPAPSASDREAHDLLVRSLRPDTMAALSRIANAAGLSRQEYLRRLLTAAAGG